MDQKGYILGSVFAGRPTSLKITLTWLIKIPDAFIDEMNHSNFNRLRYIYLSKDPAGRWESQIRYHMA